MTSVTESPSEESRNTKILTSHDPACDQCRIKKIGCDRELPSCSNCLNAKIECVRSNKGKRPNQTNKLVSDFERFGDRLGDLEKNVILIHSQLNEFLQSLPNTLRADKAQHRNDSETVLQNTAEQDHPASWPNVGQELLSEYPASNSTHTNLAFKTSSLMVLFEEADEKINLQLETLRPRTSLRDIIGRDRHHGQSPPPLMDAFLAFKTEVYHSLSLSSQTSQPDLSNDGAPLLLPPKRLLEAIVEPYFRHISSVVPIIGRRPCMEAIDKYYSSILTTENDGPAWTILFNYMILFCFVGRYMPLDRPSSDVDIVAITQFEKPFIANIRRSFAIMYKLLAPRLVNVQALVALMLVSQKYFSEHTTVYLLNQACFVAKSMGLHRQRYANDDSTAEDLEERRRIFWALFINDKDVSLLMGVSPNLHHYDCDTPLPLEVSYDFRRRLESSLILGKIYILLYSASANRAPADKVEANIDELLKALDDFEISIEMFPSKETDLGHRAWQFLMLEQRHTIHHARLMVLRRSSQPAKLEQRLSEARLCIKTIAGIHVARTTVGGFMVLRRPFQWRPFVPFFELLPTIFAYPVTSTQLADLQLLKELVDMLRVVASADDPPSYCGKLLRIAEGCIRIADEFVQQCLQHQNTASTRSFQGENGVLQRKRKLSPLPYDHQTRELYLSAEGRAVDPLVQPGLATPADAADLTSMGYDEFGSNSLPDIFPGWSKRTSDYLSFLNDGMFWGSDDLFSAQ